MAKALTIVMLLAATAAFAAAHPGLGKGFLGNVAVSGNGTDSGAAAAGNETTGATTIALTHPKFAHHGQTDLSNCQCKDDCQEEKRKVCKSREVAKEVCKEEEEEEDVVECETKCFKADKVISIGKGRRLLSANSAHTLPKIAMAKAVLAHAVLSQQGSVNATGNSTESAGGEKQEICREICKPGKKVTKANKCKKVPEKEYYDCKEEVTSSRCVKKCICGEKTITVGHAPDIHGIAAAILGAHHG